MKGKPPKNQSGFALIFFVLALMTAAGLLFTGYSQGMLESAENKKFEHNKRVLIEAKQALLQFAYNYPVTNNKGPGRLPCADTDNNGNPNTCSSLGRFPWKQANLNLYDIRDADGESLWYAVSSNFTTQAPKVNSDTSGNITLRDQQGNIIYDGSNPGSLTQYGIAAVIIAPGAAILRNDGLVQDRTVANVNAEEHYLDDTDDEDNAILNLNFSGNDDGFILGPIDGVTNDQFIVITAAEVVEVAEKAAMQAYRTAIEDYRLNTSYCDGAIGTDATICGTNGGTWTLGPYPWLFNYKSIPDVAGLTDYYPANSTINCVGEDNPEQTDKFNCELDNGTWTIGSLAIGPGAQTVHGNIGRIPSLFGSYFVDGTTGGVNSGVSVSLAISDVVSGSGTFSIDMSATQYEKFETVNGLINVGFVGGNFTAEVGAGLGETFTTDRFFWAIKHSSPESGNWTVCGSGGDELTDCPHDQEYSILRVTFTFAFDPGDIINFDLDYSAPTPLLDYKEATNTTHAWIEATFAGDKVNSLPLVTTVEYEYDEHYYEYESALGIGHSISGLGPLNTSDITFGSLTLGMRYYPELPDWAFDNDWHNSMILFYAWDYRPGGDRNCIVSPSLTNSEVSCIHVRDRDATATEAWSAHMIAVLLNTGEHDWVDPGTLLDGSGDAAGAATFLTDEEDWDRVLDFANHDLDYVVRYKWPGDPGSGTPRRVPSGNDNLLILEEQ